LVNLERDKKENDRFLNFQVNKIFIFLVLILFHLVLTLHEAIIHLFPSRNTGNIWISIFLVFLFVFLFSATKNRLSEKKFLNITFFNKKINSQYAIRLFFSFVIPVSFVGFFVRLFVIRIVPFDVQIADMLPLIQKAAEALLQGQNPYQVYYFPYAMPLTFWPGLWLIYVPSFLLSFDPRWIGLGLWTVISVILILIPLNEVKKNKSSLFLIFAGVSILLLQISIPLISFQAYGHTFGLWLWLILMSVSLIKKRFLWSAIFLGIVLASRQTSVIYVPILFAFWISQVGWLRSIKFVCVSVIVFGIIVLPLLLQSPENFLIAPIQHYARLGDYAMAQGDNGWTANAIGFSYVIQKYLGAKILSVFQGITLIFISMSSFLLARNITNLLIFLAFSVTVFSFFTPIPWLYEYFPPLLFLTLALFVVNESNSEYFLKEFASSL